MGNVLRGGKLTPKDEGEEMTTGIEMLKPEPKRKARGKGKKPALTSTSIRLPVKVMEFFSTRYPYTKQAEMRNVLAAYVDSQLNTKGDEDGLPQE